MDNRQAIGYMLLACKRSGMTTKQTQKLYSEMYYLFDIKAEEEAEQQGSEWYSKLDTEPPSFTYDQD